MFVYYGTMAATGQRSHAILLSAEFAEYGLSYSGRAGDLIVHL